MGLCLLELVAKLDEAGKNHIWLKLRDGEGFGGIFWIQIE